MEEKSFINDIFQPITKQLKNTVIPFSWIRSFPNEYQKLLERQADFLLEDGRWWRETSNGVEFADITCFNEDSSSDYVSFVKKHHFRSKTIHAVTSYLQKCWEDGISLKKPIFAFQIKIFDHENERKIERMDCLEKLKIKHYDNLQKAQPQEEEKNSIQSSFAETPISYKKCNETSSSETATKNKYLQEIPENTCFKVQDT